MIQPRCRAELVAFARYCTARIDRELAARELAGVEAWDISVRATATSGGSRAVVRARLGSSVVEARGGAFDPVAAIWEALCKIEQPLRETVRALRAA